ncbi:MAG: RpiB/LacA/LacB family sugar-phosphate isomerase [Patescibacteria group bacterium]|jgi:ribose 5-phosphate isomerase B
MLYLAADHRGFGLKESLKRYLTKEGIPFEDYGPKELNPTDDYVDYGLPVAKKVAERASEDQGILICGSGVGMDIVANKVPHVRAALVRSVHQAKAARNDDDANVLVLDADETSHELSLDIVRTWLATPFSGKERHQRRLEKIADFEVSLGQH